MNYSGSEINSISIKDKLDRWIPQYIPATVILNFLSVTTLLFKVSNDISQKHRNVNDLKWKEKGLFALEQSGVYIEHQSRLDFIKYGRQSNVLSSIFLDSRPLTGKENTCEVSAVYNCLCFLHHSAEIDNKNHNLDMKGIPIDSIIDDEFTFPGLLAYFEQKGLALGGYFGTSPMAIKRFLGKCGYQVTVLKGSKISRPSVDDMEQKRNPGELSGYILTTFNDRNHLSAMIHTMCITKEEDGFVIHNDYEGTKVYSTLSQAVFGYNKGEGKPVLLMKITREVTNE